MRRRYFIMNVDLVQPDDLLAALMMCIGEVDTQRFSVNGSQLLIKTTNLEIFHLLKKYPQYTLSQIMELTHTQEYTYDEITLLLSTPEWELIELN
jgi:hypothetical protein